jgi:tetratricopeptide (TPR) repeat protein
MPVPSRSYILDTNALLNDPEVVYAFSGADVVIPAVVIDELDRIKRKRMDRRVRFHGRKATRLLFELSQKGRLVDGIQLDNGSRLRIEEFDPAGELLPDLDPGRPDDQILALTYAIGQRPGVTSTLVSNDLNLLLRAEMLGLGTYRFEGKLEHLREKRPTPTEWFREKWLTVVLGVLVVALALSTAHLYYSQPDPSPLADLNVADDAVILENLGVSPQVLEQHYLERLAADSQDVSAMINLGNLLFEQRRYVEAAGYYRDALDVQPANMNVRTDLGIVLLQMGQFDEAIRAFERAVEDAPDLALTHYNLGVALAQHGETARAIGELELTLTLADESSSVPVFAVQSLLADLRASLADS